MTLDQRLLGRVREQLVTEGGAPTPARVAAALRRVSGGLHGVAEIMQAHGGFVVLDNSATGATLRLLFPIARKKGAAA